MNKTNGFSLVEILVALAIFAVIAAAVAMGLFSAQRTWGTGTGQAVLTAELRRALDTMSRELVGSRPAQIQMRRVVNGNDWLELDVQVLFRIPQDRNGDGSVLDANGEIAEWSNDITYAYAPGRSNSFSRTEVNDPGLQPRSLVTTLANHITAVQFRRAAATADIVEIQMTASTITELGEVMSRTMGTRVKLRN
jgi:prepilin-type N-terminal cleavage/methylation domain-containing protein